MREARECWPAGVMRGVVPRRLEIIYELNGPFFATAAVVWWEDDKARDRLSIIQDGYEPQVRMAHLAIVGSHSVNGVSQLHSELVKTRLVPELYRLWPERFSNKTNGVTQRRWLLMANPGLARLLDDAVGSGWATDFEQVRGLERCADDAEFVGRFAAVKRSNKERLATLIQPLPAGGVYPAFLFDIPANRML